MQDKRRYGDTERFDSVELEKIQDYTEEATLRVLLNAILGGKSATFGLAVSRDAANTANAPTLLIAAGGAFTPAASGRQDAASTMLLPVNATATDVTYEVCVKVVRLLKDAASPITEIDVASGALQSTTIDKRDYAGIQLGYYVKGQVPSGQGWIVLVEAIVNQNQGVTTIADKRPALHTLLGARPDGTAGSHHTGRAGAAEKINLEDEVQGRLPIQRMDLTAPAAASEIGFVPPANSSFPSTITNVQAAIVEAGADTTAHIDKSTAAHAASAISFTPPAGSSLAATDVQSAIVESEAVHHVGATTSGDPPYATGWWQLSESLSPIDGVWYHRDREGYVTIWGAAEHDPGVGDSTIFILPDGFRPTRQVLIASPQRDPSVSDIVFGIVSINPAGAVACVQYATTTGVFISARFKADA